MDIMYLDMMDIMDMDVMAMDIMGLGGIAWYSELFQVRKLHCPVRRAAQEASLRLAGLGGGGPFGMGAPPMAPPAAPRAAAAAPQEWVGEGAQGGLVGAAPPCRRNGRGGGSAAAPQCCPSLAQ